MKIKRLIPVLAISLMFAGCSAEAIPHEETGSVFEEVNKEPSSEEETTETKPEEVTSGEELTAEERNEFTRLFNTSEYNGFLDEAFMSPEEIEWDEVLGEDGAGFGIKDPGADEINDFLKAVDRKKYYGTLLVVRASDLKEYARTHAGIDSLPEDVLSSWDYVKERDSYYKEVWENELIGYTCVSGMKDGDRYTVRFTIDDNTTYGYDPSSHMGKFADRVITFTKNDENYVMESNEIMWDENCDKEQTFDVELNQFDELVHFVTYYEPDGKSSIYLIKDGKSIGSSNLFVSGEGLSYIKKVLAVGFFDFDCDKMDDILLIGDSDQGKYAIMFQAVKGDYYGCFDWFADLDEAKVAKLGADFTIADLKCVILGGKKEPDYGDYKAVYEQIARAYNIYDEKCEFDLIYADDDNIPELVAGDTGYWVSLYTYENGKAHCLMNHWGYGAGGNAGYYYAPKTGMYFNGNADYAGAVYYEYYMSKRDEGEIATDYWIKNINFNDTDGDGEPTGEELEASGGYEGTSEYHDNTGKNLTEAQIKEIIDGYAGYETECIVGNMNYDALIEKLK